jgi:hypothetical protein
MPTIDIPDKICPHCGGIKWYQHGNRYWCYIRRNEKQKALFKNRNKEKYNDTRRLTNSYKEKLIKEKQKRQEYRKVNPVIKKTPLTTAQRSAKYYLKIKNNPKYKIKNVIRSNKHFKRNKEELNDKYIKSILCSDPGLSFSDIPQELIELKRKQLILTRKIKNNGKDQSSNSNN